MEKIALLIHIESDWYIFLSETPCMCVCMQLQLLGKSFVLWWHFFYLILQWNAMYAFYLYVHRAYTECVSMCFHYNHLTHFLLSGSFVSFLSIYLPLFLDDFSPRIDLMSSRHWNSSETLHFSCRQNQRFLESLGLISLETTALSARKTPFANSVNVFSIDCSYQWRRRQSTFVSY